MSTIVTKRLGYFRKYQSEADMQRVDGAYLYEMGAIIRPVSSLSEQDSSVGSLYWTLSPVREAVKTFLYSSVFSAGLKTVGHSANGLLSEIDKLVPVPAPDTDWTSTIPGWQVASLKSAFRKFEAVLLAELQTLALYHVAPKGGLDTGCLTDAGAALFPAALPGKVAEAVPDIVVGARCMAFGLWTAMGFHFHRANEAVLRRYYASVIGNAKQPKYLTMGSMISSMKQHDVGDKSILAALDNIREFHRNPIAHPDHSLETEEEALSLYAAIRAAVGYMLSKLPPMPPSLAPIIAPPPLQLNP